MKMWWCYLLGLLVLTGCKNKEMKVEYQLIQPDTSVYAIDDVTEELVRVDIDFAIESKEDIFYLYTIYQNHLPVGVHSNGNGNIELIDCYEQDEEVYYVVNSFILLVDELPVFQSLITKTNALYHYGPAHFILNGRKLT